MRVGGKHRDYEEGETNELMSESYSRRSWKGIAIAFLVIGAVAAIVTLIVIYSGSPTPWYLDGTLTLPDVINGKYNAKTFSSSVWTTNDSFLYMESQNLMSYSIPENKTTTVVQGDIWEKDFDSFYPSPSGKYILYSYNKTKKFRHSYSANFQVLSLTNSGKNFTKFNVSDGKLLQYACWGPNDQIAFVQENNIFYLKSFESELEEAVNVTNDGKPDIIFNGIPDWVYEEEIISSESAIWWSPDGNYFAFMKFDDTNVADMHYMKYGSSDQYYPSVIGIKYPKPGTENPTVSVWVVSTSSPQNPQRVNFSKDRSANEIYVTSVTWAGSSSLAVMWGPRIQNQSFVSICKESSSDWTCNIDSTEESSGWLEPRNPYFSNDGTKYFLLQSNKNYKHISMHTVNIKGSTFLTVGNPEEFEATSIVHFDNNSTLYYIRTGKDKAETRQLHRLSGIPDQIEDVCLSCKENCDWVSASVSLGKYYTLTCSSSASGTVPTVDIFTLGSDMYVSTWEDNQELKDKLSNQTLADYRDFTIPVSVSDPNEGSIKIRVFLPKNYTETRKYPALINVYGGPGSQMIQNTFGIDFGTYLVTNKNILYVEVDGRGSAFRGDKLLFKLHKKLGTVEIEDQITAMKYLLRNQSFVDPNRVAIWGWSYGGYAAAMTLAKGKDIFTCAMSVAPVTSWHYYDSAYTERYMLRPQDNMQSYENSELMKYVSDFKNKHFLLLHGTADDNVHFQQSMMLTTALNNASIIFDMHIYPDENHSIPKSKLHVYLTLEDFLSNCFT